MQKGLKDGAFILKSGSLETAMLGYTSEMGWQTAFIARNYMVNFVVVTDKNSRYGYTY